MLESQKQTPENLKADIFGNLAENVTRKTGDVFKKVQDIVTKLPPAQAGALSAVTIGALIYMLAPQMKKESGEESDKKDEVSKESKEGKKEPEKTLDPREKLRDLAQVCPVLPVIPAKVLEEMPANLKGTGKGMVKRGVTGDHCWDWSDKVFHMAGCKRNVVFNVVNEYASNKYEVKDGKKQYVKTPDCGIHHAYEKEYAMLEPGDHIFVNNKNPYDNHGNHSEIFLGWADKSKMIARTAGYPGKGRPSYIRETRDFNKHPVTYIAKPVPVGNKDGQEKLVS